MRSIFHAFRRIVGEHEGVDLVYCIHRNPTIRALADEMLSGVPGVHLVEPPDYGVFVQLLKASYMILTDSGGIQEEAPALGKPTLVLRENTERPEAVQAGVVELVGSDADRIVTAAHRLLTDPEAYAAMAHARNPFGDGKAGERIAQALMYHFGMSAERPADLLI